LELIPGGRGGTNCDRREPDDRCRKTCSPYLGRETPFTISKWPSRTPRYREKPCLTPALVTLQEYANLFSSSKFYRSGSPDILALLASEEREFLLGSSENDDAAVDDESSDQSNIVSSSSPKSELFVVLSIVGSLVLVGAILTGVMWRYNYFKRTKYFHVHNQEESVFRIVVKKQD